MAAPEKITIFTSYIEAIGELDNPVDRCELYEAIFSYVFDGVEPEFDGENGNVKRMAWKLMLPNIKSSIKRSAGQRTVKPKPGHDEDGDTCSGNSREIREKFAGNSREIREKLSSNSYPEDKEEDKEEEKEEDEEDGRRACAISDCMIQPPPADASVVGPSGEEHDTMLSALLAYMRQQTANPAGWVSLFGTLCPPGCDARPERCLVCYQLAVRAIQRYDPSRAATPMPLFERMVAEEREALWPG